MKFKKLSQPYKQSNLTDDSLSPRYTNLTLDELSPDLNHTL